MSRTTTIIVILMKICIYIYIKLIKVASLLPGTVFLENFKKIPDETPDLRPVKGTYGVSSRRRR